MNVEMWNHSATQANIKALRARGVEFIDPDSGYQACGEVGMGRLAEPEEIVKRALTDAAAKKPAIVLEEWGPKIQGLATSRASRLSEKEKAASADYRTKAAAEPGAVQTASGLIYKEVRPGTGESPKATDQVKVPIHPSKLSVRLVLSPDARS